MTQSSIFSLIKVIALFLIIFLWPVWERFPGGFTIVLLGLLVLIGVLWLFIDFIREVIGVLRNWRIKKTNVVRGGIIVIGSILLISIPYNVEDLVFGEVTFRACYEGTQNQATFKLRGKDTFEIRHTGVFFYDKFYRGKYVLDHDTLRLSFNGDIHEYFGELVLLDSSDNYVKPIKGDSAINSRRNFYFGYCKGLN